MSKRAERQAPPNILAASRRRTRKLICKGQVCNFLRHGHVGRTHRRREDPSIIESLVRAQATTVSPALFLTGLAGRLRLSSYQQTRQEERPLNFPTHSTLSPHCVLCTKCIAEEALPPYHNLSESDRSPVFPFNCRFDLNRSCPRCIELVGVLSK